MLTIICFISCVQDKKQNTSNKKPIKAPCIPDYIRYKPWLSFIKTLKDTGQIINNEKSGYWIEFQVENKGKRKFIVQNPEDHLPFDTAKSRDLEIINNFLLEGLYKDGERIGLWRKYLNFDKAIWILWEDIYFEKGVEISSELKMIDAENLFSNELIAYPSCNPFFFKDKTLQFLKYKTSK